MKKLFYVFLSLLTIYLVYTYKDTIIEYIVFNFIYKVDEVSSSHNEYKLDYNYGYVKQTVDFTPSNKEDIINIIYTGLNNGWDKISFYCSNEYENCMEDVKTITNDKLALSNINNFVHPFNSYYKLNMTINNLGKVDIEIIKLYGNDEIILINNKVNEILKNNITDTMTQKEKIKVIHDYIINNNKYDSDRANNLNNPDYIGYKSHTAYGPLFEGYAICSGYSDLMAIFLNKLEIPNYKISTDKHVWNLVYIDNNWYHLDLTWDDPVVNTGENILLDKFFLITTKDLQEIDTNEHLFDKNIYKEA